MIMFLELIIPIEHFKLPSEEIRVNVEGKKSKNIILFLFSWEIPFYIQPFPDWHLCS